MQNQSVANRVASGIATVIPIAFLGYFFVWPVLTMLGKAFIDESGEFSVQALIAVGTDEKTWQVTWQTIWMAICGTAGSLIVGMPMAYVVYRLKFPGRLFLRAIISAPFALPTVVVGIAFNALLNPSGPLGFLGLNNTIFAVIMAFIFFNCSVVTRIVGSMWAGLDDKNVLAARTLGASGWQAFWTVTLPQLGPAIAAAASLVFLFCTTSFGIVQTLGSPGFGTLETEIYQQATAYTNFSAAAVLSGIQILIVVLTLVISSRLSSHSESALARSKTVGRPITKANLPVLITVLVLTLLIVVAPLAALVIGSLNSQGEWGIGNYLILGKTGTGFAGGTSVLEATANSIRIAFDAMMISLVICIPLAFVLSIKTKTKAASTFQKAVEGLATAPLGVSAVTLGFGLLVTFANSWLAETRLIVPVAQAVVALPLVVRSLVPALRSINPRLHQAAATLGASPAKIILSIDIPLVARGIGLAAGFAFAMSLGEFGATSFLASPDYQTLPVLIAKLLSRPGQDNYGMALAGAVILAVLTSGVMTLTEILRLPAAKGQNRNA